MLASPTYFDASWLVVVWTLAIGLASISSLMLAALSVRRARKRKAKAFFDRQASDIDAVLSALIAKDIAPEPMMLPPATPRNIDAIISVLLRYFRNLSPGTASVLSNIVEVWAIEPFLSNKVRKGRRGLRIQAITVLSYLNSQPSLDCLLELLDSKDIYIRLAAIRSLARRDSSKHLQEIIASLNIPEQKNPVLLYDILQRFGRDGAWAMEYLVTHAKNSTIRAASLEALRDIGVEKISFSIAPYLIDPDPLVRAAAISLIPLGHTNPLTLLQPRLNDLSPKVRLRVLDVLETLHSSEGIKAVSHLIRDPDWNVRYKAFRTMKSLGSKGEAYLRVVCARNGENSEMAKAVLSERLAA